MKKLQAHLLATASYLLLFGLLFYTSGLSAQISLWPIKSFCLVADSLTAKEISSSSITCPNNQILKLEVDGSLLVPDFITNIPEVKQGTSLVIEQKPLAGSHLPSTEGKMHFVSIIAKDAKGNSKTCLVTLIGRDGQ